MLVLAAVSWAAIRSSDRDTDATEIAATAAAAIIPPAATAATQTPTTTTPPTQPAVPSTRLRLHLIKTITGHITPKSVDSDQTGLIFAQNMVYTHTVTVYDSHSMKLVKTIPDRVTPSKFGIKGYPGSDQGGPVEVGVLARQEVRLRLQLPDVRQRLHTTRVR